MPKYKSPDFILGLATSILQCIAIFLMVFRLWYRFSIRRFWWEDAWAAVALFCGIAALISFWVHVGPAPGPAIAAYWVYTFAFPCVIWAVRLSVLYSIIRLIYPVELSIRIANVSSALFTLLWAGVVGSKAYWCGSNIAWYKAATLSCSMPRGLDIYELCTDVVSDTILVGLSLRILWNIKLPGVGQRRMVLCVFSSSMIVTLTSLLRAAARLLHMTSLTVIASDFEMAASLIVCNLLVTVTYIYRTFRKDGVSDATDTGDEAMTGHTAFPPDTVRSLTTVDLDYLSNSGSRWWSKGPDVPSSSPIQGSR
ncbi:hypothetical protein BJ138DRAFT_1161271 [Hygrophoropsis aurantiaca]|uniref:Uncharacterized protein n=1 Tax=Hygrophoropsis aurantiaca TaxID=72124 RepID=A0ACB8A0S0_9AGAM|nr:hypothetical protein BJ138DRAFT_1161271 [Hygrophoropsis aurantiaca]